MSDDSPQAIRAEALESILIEKGLLTAEAVDDVITRYSERVGPMNGARLVARAWIDPEFKKQLLTDATSIVESFGFEGGQVEKLVVVENTEKVHNAVVCTLCSCYPWAVLGLPPRWYKDPAYRSRIVMEPRQLLAEMGVGLNSDVEIQVWDSSAEIRYMVLPMQPPGTHDLNEEQLAELVTRDSMIGVEVLVEGLVEGSVVSEMGLQGIIEPPMANGEVVFDAPWQSRVFGMARALCEQGLFTWDEFREQLILQIETYNDDGEYQYFTHFFNALTFLLEKKQLFSSDELIVLSEQLSARPHGHDHDH